MVFEAIVALPEIGELDRNQARGVLGAIEFTVSTAVVRTWGRGGSVGGGGGCFISGPRFSNEPCETSNLITSPSDLAVVFPKARLVRRDSRETRPCSAGSLGP